MKVKVKGEGEGGGGGGGREVKEVLPCKENVPHTPLRETNPIQETRQVCNCSCLSRTPRAHAKKRVDRALLQRMIESAVDDAVRTFHGTRSADTHGNSDERLWAGIAKRISANAMRYAVIDCLAEMRDQKRPVDEKDQARYFQAFLNKHYPDPRSRSKVEVEGGAK